MKLPFWVDLLLRAFPAGFRAAHRREIEEFVEEELAGVGRGRLWAALRIGFDLVRSAVRLRLRPVRRGIWAMMAGRGGDAWIGTLLGDLGLAARGLLRSRGFTLVVVLTLVLGIGLNTSLFSVVNAVLMKPLDYAQPGRLVYLDARLTTRDVSVTVSGGDLNDLRAGVPAFEAVHGVASIRQNLSGAGLPRQVEVGWLSNGFLEMLGNEPLLGRVHAPDDGPGTVVISHQLWADAFGSDPEVLGQTIRLDGYPGTIVGVMPAAFRVRLPANDESVLNVDVWKNPDSFWQNGDIWNAQGPAFSLLQVVARLAPGAVVADAQSEVDAVVADLRSRYPEHETNGLEVKVAGLQERMVEQVRPTLLLLLGAVGLVLLIACANVANLTAVRGQSRMRENAIRLALGSPRSRVGRLLVIESLLLVASGTGLGLLLAFWTVGAVRAMAPPDFPLVDAVGLDGAVFAFAAAVALLTILLVGLIPAVNAARTDPGVALGNGRVVGTAGSGMRDGLVVVQVALSLMLLIGAGLLTSSLIRLQEVELGFDPNSVYTFGVSIPGTQYGWPEQAGQFYREVEAQVAALPGVSAAGVVWPMPFGGSWSGDHTIMEAEVVPLGAVDYRLATEAYFPTIGIPLDEGRLFRDLDGRQVAVVTRSVARRAWPGRSAIGETLQANPWGGGLLDFEVIGVVGDIRDHDVREDPRGTIYFDARSWSWVDWEVHVVARTDVASAALLPGLRGAVAQVDAEVPLAHPRAMEDAFASQTASERFVLLLLGAFAVTAAALAMIGLYGVISFTIGLRAQEIGVRIALGCGNGGIQRMVLGRGMTLTLVGVGLGLVGAWLLGGLLEALLFGVTPTDPMTYAVVVAFLGSAALVATWVPAWKAGRVDPVEVLRAS